MSKYKYCCCASEGHICGSDEGGRPPTFVVFRPTHHGRIIVTAAEVVGGGVFSSQRRAIDPEV